MDDRAQSYIDRVAKHQDLSDSRAEYAIDLLPLIVIKFHVVVLEELMERSLEKDMITENGRQVGKSLPGFLAGKITAVDIE